jgi:hypothetical protein
LQRSISPEGEKVQFACNTCGHPAVTLPDELHEEALVCCQSCRAPIATWAAFKQRTTQIILSGSTRSDELLHVLSPDPLDPVVLQDRSRVGSAA